MDEKELKQEENIVSYLRLASGADNQRRVTFEVEIVFGMLPFPNDQKQRDTLVKMLFIAGFKKNQYFFAKDNLIIFLHSKQQVRRLAKILNKNFDYSKTWIVKEEENEN